MNNTTTVQEILQPATRGLPPQFVKRSRAYFKARTRGNGFQRLPFVAVSRTPATAPAWNVPATGGYFGGYKTGEAMATMMMKALHNEPQRCSVSWLTAIIQSLMIRFEEEGGKTMLDGRASKWSDSFDSLRGQWVDFFNTITKWLAVAVTSLNHGLMDIADAVLLHIANTGLAFDHPAYMAQLSDEE